MDEAYRVEKAADISGLELTEGELALINRYALRELAAAEVFAFKVTACDNEIDRDGEAFDTDALGKLAELFIGKPVILDHNPSAANQCARVYAGQVAREDRPTAYGEGYARLEVRCYMLRTEETADKIAKLEGGILKEVSVGCSVAKRLCSVCGARDCGHVPGQEYEGKRCFSRLTGPVDAYELSFVAVPAQPAAGVTKQAKPLDNSPPRALEYNKPTFERSTKQMNRWQLESMRTGVAQELEEAKQTFAKVYADASVPLEERKKQKAVVEDVKERLEGLNKQIQEMDDEAARRLQKTQKPGNEKDARVVSKAALYRSVMHGKPVPEEHYKALADNADTGGGKFLPKTVASEIIEEPMVKNPLRNISTITNITNLELPKIAFSLDDDDFIEDGATAKELAATGQTVAFGRNKFKVFSDVSETVLLGSDANLVAVVDRGLESGLAKKEKKVAFDPNPAEANKHMSFYAKTSGAYDITETACDAGTGVYDAILAAIADLEEDYRENATVVMRYADYLGIINTLANGSATLYAAQPEQILGKPVVFCDLATIPVVGDFSYSHYNYDIGMQYERDKNVKTGMESFVLTAWFDHQIKMKAAFRLATVKQSQP